MGTRSVFEPPLYIVSVSNYQSFDLLCRIHSASRLVIGQQEALVKSHNSNGVNFVWSVFFIFDHLPNSVVGILSFQSKVGLTQQG